MLREMVGENDQLTTKSKVDLSYLPPCRDNLIPHIQCVTHRLAIYQSHMTMNKVGKEMKMKFWSQCGRVAQ